MKPFWVISAACCIAVCLCQCHFHYTNPQEVLLYRRCFLDIDQLDPIYPWVYRFFTSRNMIITVRPEEAQITLKLLQSTQTKEPISRDYSGLINAYRLRYQANFSFLTKSTLFSPEHIHLDMWQKQAYSNNAILAKNDEEEYLWTTLYQRAAQRLFMMMRFMKRRDQPLAGTQKGQ